MIRGKILFITISIDDLRVDVIRQHGGCDWEAVGGGFAQFFIESSKIGFYLL